jgi:hypothetical protein
MRTWHDLSEAERHVMILAGEEGMLWEVCAELKPVERGIDVTSEGRRVTGGLAREGLLWFYRLEVGTPSLSEAEVVALLNSPAQWTRNEQMNTVANICLYATEDGQHLLGA